ncbi:lipoyl(octanoyl) transferase LipB [Candidatus Puniceispirillum sp.]|nr:lipoyl(octanoyl) transferase LipB [Candidatus Puniceispirillum sp.]
MPTTSNQFAPTFPIEWLHFEGLQLYQPTLALMQERAKAIRQDGAKEAVWALEHHPIYTGGTSAKHDDLLAPGSVPTLRVGRGGQWTWHGPGQRVVYVMLDLSIRGQDVRALIDRLEGWIIASLSIFGVSCQRRDGSPGIWVYTGKGSSGLEKIAAIGLRISRWVSWHGIAINLNPNLAAFDAIVPCGVTDGGVTSLSKLGVLAKMNDLDKVLKEQFLLFFSSTQQPTTLAN